MNKVLWAIVAVIAAIVLFVMFYANPSFAKDDLAAWSNEDMNKLIDQTNFIIDGRCSGTLISLQYRLILTNNHCSEHKVSTVEEDVTGDDGEVRRVKREKREDLPVVQNHYDGFAQVGSTDYTTEIVAYDKAADLALLQIKQKVIPFTQAAPLLPDGVDLMRGEPTVTVGNPMLLEATVVKGEISSLHRQIAVGGDDKRDYIQFSGGIFGGNSGGALYNAKGQLIGVPGAGSQAATFIGLAIPIERVKALLKKQCMASIWDHKADDAACVKAKEKKAKDAKKDDE
jgi:S1-C subfamily serine protease